MLHRAEATSSAILDADLELANQSNRDKHNKMLHIDCRGSPYEIGQTHGKTAKELIARTITFYTDQFLETAKIDWNKVREIASEFQPVIETKWPLYLEEMQGLADGAGVELLDIIAINVRTEISFGLFSDGCTALSWSGEGYSFLAQNWDWNRAQKQNLIHLTIHRSSTSTSITPSISMITEAGLIGKIGLNSSGVGVCLNAIRALGLDSTRLPCHLALRMVLESPSRSHAVSKLEEYGVASACHMLIADATGGVGVECSSRGLKKVEMNARGQVFHSNHYLLQPDEGVVDTNWLEDSKLRVTRIEELCGELEKGQGNGKPSTEGLGNIFEDQQGYPTSICRKQEGDAASETLFGIVMDLQMETARVRMGRPSEPDEEFEMGFA